ncbi:MAG: DUF3368 domain-containing protein [Thermoleophilia bacterium]|nr:DUF3368 domain-containing protein [Thermoleophilia bacterium]
MLAHDLVVAEFTGYEEYDVQVADLTRWGVNVGELPGETVAEVDLAEKYRGPKAPSVADLLAFLLARDRGAVLLTDDRRLAKVAADAGVETHGSLWVLDWLLRDSCIDPATALEALEKMEEAGCRLPAGEVERRRVAWRRRTGSGE